MKRHDLFALALAAFLSSVPLSAAPVTAQVIICPGATAGQPWESCTPTLIASAPKSSDMILNCAVATVIAAGDPRSVCTTTRWEPESYMPSYGWTLTQDHGWQRWGDITFATGPTPPPPPPPPDPPPTPTVGTATLVWLAPTQNTDGTAITSALTYEVQQSPTFAAVATTAARTYAFTNLAAGNWCWQVVAITSGGRSDPSNQVCKTIAAGPVCTHPASPATAQPVQCVPPTTGIWTQTRACTESACPVAGGATTWTCTAWAPAVMPPGICATPTAVWKVAVNGTLLTRPVYELIRTKTDTAWTLGNKLGDIPVGKSCDAVLQWGTATNGYHKVLEADTVLLSPTYRGRTGIALCVNQ